MTAAHELLALAPIVASLILFAVSLTASYFLQQNVSQGKGSPHYGLDSLANARRQGDAIPILLCTRRKIEPILINVLTKQEGVRQTFRLLYLLGYGELESMESDWWDRLFINDQPASAFPLAKKNSFLPGSSFFSGSSSNNWTPGLKVTFRYGTANQTAIPGFDRIGRGRDYGVVLQGPSTGVEAISVTHEMVAEAEEIHLLLVWPSGIHRVDDSKGIRGDSGGLKIEYKDADDPKAQWKAADLDKTLNPDWRGNIASGKAAVAGEFWTSGDTTATLRRQIEIKFKAKGRYYVRMTGLHPDTNTRKVAATLASVNEVEKETRTYAGYALMAVEGVATEQLSGGLPRVSLITRGLKLTDPRTGSSGESSNPAVQAYNVYLNPTWGCGYDASDLDGGTGGTFRTVADNCDTLISVTGQAQEKAWESQIVLDARAPAEDHLAQLLTTFRAVTFEYDGLIRIAQDVARSSDRTLDARQVTTNRKNVLALPDGTPDFRVPQIPVEKQFNMVSVAYVDGKDDVFGDETYSYPETTPADPRAAELRLDAVTRTSQAKRETVYNWRVFTLCRDMLDVGVGWGEHDILPHSRVTLYDDYRYPSGSDWLVLNVSIDPATGAARLLCRKYDASVYDGISVSPAKAAGYINIQSSPSSKGSSTSPETTSAAAKTGGSSGAAQGQTQPKGVTVLTFTPKGIVGKE